MNNFAATTWDLDGRTVNASADVNLTNLDTFTVVGSTFIFDGTTTLNSARAELQQHPDRLCRGAGSLTLGDNLDVNGTVAVTNVAATTWAVTTAR